MDFSAPCANNKTLIDIKTVWDFLIYHVQSYTFQESATFLLINDVEVIVPITFDVEVFAPAT